MGLLLCYFSSDLKYYPLMTKMAQLVIDIFGIDWRTAPDAYFAIILNIAHTVVKLRKICAEIIVYRISILVWHIISNIAVNDLFISCFSVFLNIYCINIFIYYFSVWFGICRMKITKYRFFLIAETFPLNDRSVTIIRIFSL